VKFKATHVLYFGLLIVGVGHVMIIQNGFWHDSILMISISSLVILVTVYRYLENNEKKNKAKRTKKYEDL